ncbi:VOC family protein [Pseudochryseolinea flava]|uniref:VOC family protein n=1 Tax=Pseudochryseolinea flava TaxID=2059302 RepID=A0A364Y1T2_9BACT|nr:VOC family protein [Pseudochryseolinea flava]RAW00825.1 VOC family protein [Pseudochryseolinea flava]
MESKAHTLRGLTTLNFFAADHSVAVAWYTKFLGFAPNFERPGYAEFRIGDFKHEFGIIDARFAPGTNGTPGGAIMYWHVDDLEGTLEKLIALGATPFEKIMKRGEGFITASVVDPFGNVLGIMYNRHYLEVHGKVANHLQ